MKNKKEKLKAKYGHQVFTTKEANDCGVSSRMLSFYVKTGELERVRRGLYAFPDFKIKKNFLHQDLALTAKSIKGSVICLISALIYWKLTEEYQGRFYLALPNNYPLPTKTKKIKFIRPRDLKTGVLNKEIANQKIKITNPERSVCEAFKHLDEETAITSLRMYMEQGSANITKLLNTAKTLKSNKVIKIMSELAHAKAKDYPEMDRDNLRAVIDWSFKKAS